LRPDSPVAANAVIRSYAPGTSGAVPRTDFAVVSAIPATSSPPRPRSRFLLRARTTSQWFKSITYRVRNKLFPSSPLEPTARRCREPTTCIGRAFRHTVRNYRKWVRCSAPSRLRSLREQSL
jgi:hypothetical protein